jgi:hypothetical protein
VSERGGREDFLLPLPLSSFSLSFSHSPSPLLSPLSLLFLSLTLLSSFSHSLPSFPPLFIPLPSLYLLFSLLCPLLLQKDHSPNQHFIYEYP